MLTEFNDPIQPAYEVRVPDEQLRAQMQTQVLASDYAVFLAAVEAFRNNFKQRPVVCKLLPRIVELDDSESDVSAEQSIALQRQLDRLISLHAPPNDLANYGWKMQLLPAERKNVLSIGCGGGSELIWLRARYPRAKITALDYTLGVRGGRGALDKLDVDFLQGNIFETAENLRQRGSRYDLIFSNHVVEHFYDPDKQIAFLSSLLQPGGIWSAGLPLDGYPLADLLAEIAKEPHAIHPLDMNWLDVRHPWKTTECDLASTLLNAGLADVTVYRRASHFGNSARPMSRTECKSRERAARRIYARSVGPVVSAAKMLFRSKPPTIVARLIFAIDRRLWFGRYRVKMEVQPEVFVTALRRSDP
jgi:2-polyprenyl-3-methyl-5-hydroxy-6-metoxy-1,4-benzoquinol methylase